MTPTQQMHDAARQGDLDRMQALIEADPRLVHALDTDSPWPTPLHEAAARGHKEAVQFLIAQGADARWRGAQTPLHVAWQGQNNQAVIRLLVANGAAHSEVFAAVYLNDGPKLRALLKEDWTRVAEQDDAGMTPLHRAAENGEKEIVEVLVAYGADVEAKTSEGQTPLQRSYYHSHILETLLAHGAQLDMATAINVGKIDYIAHLLAKHPALVHARWAERTPLQIAARGASADLVELLLDSGAEVNARGGWKDWTPLHWAAHDNRLATAKLLLKRGADVAALDDEHHTPLELAEASGHREMARLLRRAAREA